MNKKMLKNGSWKLDPDSIGKTPQVVLLKFIMKYGLDI